MSKVVTNFKVTIFDDSSNSENKRFNDLCNLLNDKGITINHYFYEENKDKFITDKNVWMLINCAGREMLPATYINNQLIKIEEYPTKSELYTYLTKIGGK